MSLRRHLPVWLLAAAPAAGLAADCAPQPGCQVPSTCTPPVYCCPPQERSAPRQAPPGNYVRGPSTGEAIGESNSIGIRGLGIRIPEMNIRLPTIELPSFVSIRREAEMVFDAGRGPFVEGEPAEFRMVEPEDREPPAQRSAPTNRCGETEARGLPPGPAPESHNGQPAPMPPSTTQRRKEVEAREHEIALLRQQVAEMQALLREMKDAQVQPSTALAPRPTPADASQPALLVRHRIEPAAYVEDGSVVDPKAQPSFGLSKPSRPTVPPPSRPIARRPSMPMAASEASEFGSWSSPAKR